MSLTFQQGFYAEINLTRRLGKLNWNPNESFENYYFYLNFVRKMDLYVIIPSMKISLKSSLSLLTSVSHLALSFTSSKTPKQRHLLRYGTELSCP